MYKMCSFPPKTSRLSDITRHLEEICAAAVDACNRRDYDMNSPAWKHTSPDFVGNTHQGTGHAKLNFQQYMEFLKSEADAHPGFHCNVLGMSTYVDRSAGYARVFVDAELLKAPPDIVRNGISVTEFRYIDGQWLVIAGRLMRGPDALLGPCIG